MNSGQWRAAGIAVVVVGIVATACRPGNCEDVAIIVRDNCRFVDVPERSIKMLVCEAGGVRVNMDTTGLGSGGGGE